MKKAMAIFFCVFLAMAAFAQAPAAETRVLVDLSAGTAAVYGAQPVTIGSDTMLAEGISARKTAYGFSLEASGAAKVAWELKGSLEGTLNISSDSDTTIVLNGARIEAAEGPALNIKTKKRTTIELASESANVFADTAKRIKELDEKAALSSKGTIEICGDGSLEIDAHYKNGIYTKEYIRIYSGTIRVSVTARDGIRADKGFILDGGDLSILGTGAGIDEESKGIKVDGVEGDPASGGIVINGGTLTIRTVGKGITAAWEAEEDAKTPDVADDPDPDVTIRGGTIEVTTTGKPYERKDEKGNTVSCSPEGIEAKSDLVITGGDLEIRTADDCLNAGDSIRISGGKILAVSSANDAIDSNGTLSISGGYIVAVGSGGPEGAFDCDANEFSVTGGTMLGFGGTTSGPTTSASTQNILIAGGFPTGSEVSVRDPSGKTLIAFSSPVFLPTTIFSTPGLTIGTEYTIWVDGVPSATFTPTGTITQIGGMIFGPGPGPGPGGFGGQPPEGAFPPPEGMGPPPEGWTPPTASKP
ncbi:MAG TPA: carbohydrate-binding domain-containing protein [Rectinemataceae bacterium]